MPRNIILTAIIVLCSAALSSPAQALSCAPVAMDQTTYDAADMIFEGHVIKTTEKTVGLNGQDAGKATTYTFAITTMWKGDPAIKQVDIENDVHWGPWFQTGTSYLLAIDEHDGKYTAPLCGYAGTAQNDPAAIEFLKSRNATVPSGQ